MSYRLAVLVLLAVTCAAAFAPASVAAQSSLVASTVTVPQSHPSAYLRGVVFREGPKGPVVVDPASSGLQVGETLSKIDGQEVRTISDFFRLSEGKSAHTMTWTMTTTGGPTLKDWADALRVSETPRGVRIDASTDPKHVGQYLTAINRKPVEKVSDILPLLVELRKSNTNEISYSPIGSDSYRAASAAKVLASPDVKQRETSTGPAGSSWFCGGFDGNFTHLYRSAVFVSGASASALKLQWSTQMKGMGVAAPQSPFCFSSAAAGVASKREDVTQSLVDKTDAKVVDKPWSAR